MTTPVYEFYRALEPNHTVRVDEDGFQLVRCPFIDAETSWSPNANPEEVNCLFCEYLQGAEEHAGPPIPCDEHPPIAGGSHDTRQALEYRQCKVPLRRIVGAFDVTLVVHEGIVGDLWEADRRWRAMGGAAWFLIRQRDTGSYNCRNSAGHSRAVAIDFNWSDNGYRKPRPKSGCPQQAGMREFYEVCWKPLGYGWGGLWVSACDAMHISKLKNEGGDGRMYVRHSGAAPEPLPPTPTPTEDEDMQALFMLKDKTNGRVYAVPDLEDAIHIVHPEDMNAMIKGARAAGIKCTDPIPVHPSTIKAFSRRDGDDL